MIQAPTLEAIEFAAHAIRNGQLVGMPTETVYGIAADALNPTAVKAVFDLKGRPADNPLIVHLSSIEAIESVAREFPPVAQQLAVQFWPGPLTLVLPKRPEVPTITTGGLDTVAVRVPFHPVAQALLRQSGRPIAAPSANLFMRLSPTRATDILPEIADGLAIILDGGPCNYGIESTVVDLTGQMPKILRLGSISESQLREVTDFASEPPTERRSPGQYPRHYAPRSPVQLQTQLEPGDAGLTFDSPSSSSQIQMPGDPAGYAVQLYSALHDLDRIAPDAIVIQSPPQTPEWSPIWDRLLRAIHPTTL